MSAYREPSFPNEPKERWNKKFGRVGREAFEFVVFDSMPINLILLAAVAICVVVFAAYHASEAQQMHDEYDTYLLGRDTCASHDGWYDETRNYNTHSLELIGCRLLTDHSVFWVNRDTGLALRPLNPETGEVDDRE